MNRIAENIDKFKNPSIHNTDSKLEVERWIAEYCTDSNIVKFISHVKNIITLKFFLANGVYLIDIIHPDNYPNDKIGFKCKERLMSGIKFLTFMNKINEKFENKTLSIDRVLTYILNQFINI